MERRDNIFDVVKQANKETKKDFKECTEVQREGFRAPIEAVRLVKKMRQERGLTQSKLALKLGLKQGRISQIEGGKANYGISLKQLDEIAAACGYRVEIRVKKID